VPDGAGADAVVAYLARRRCVGWPFGARARTERLHPGV